MNSLKKKTKKIQKTSKNLSALDGYSRFTALNESFTCIYCQTQVPPLKTSYRNHCPKCLRSLHVDHLPGDRANSCHGVMHPVAYTYHHKKGIDLTFKCERCGQISNNKATTKDPLLPDDLEVILKVTQSSLLE